MLKIGVAQRHERFPGGRASRHGGEAPPRIPVLLQVKAHHRQDAQALLAVHVPASNEMIAQRPAPVAGPRLKGGDELHLVNQAVLQREQPEEKIVIGGHRSGSLGTSARNSMRHQPAESTVLADLFLARSPGRLAYRKHRRSSIVTPRTCRRRRCRW